MAKSQFNMQQERLWKTVDKLKDEYRKYLKQLSKEELLEEFMDMSTDRFYAAFTTDLVMNVFLQEGILDDKEANTLPMEYFKNEINTIKERRLLRASKGVKTVKKTVKKKTAKKAVKKSAKKVVKKKTAKKATKKTAKRAKK